MSLVRTPFGYNEFPRFPLVELHLFGYNIASFREFIPDGVYFAMKGLPVAECGYRDADICEQQIRDLVRFREQTPEETSERLTGYIHTIWSSSGAFLRRYNAITRGEEMPGGRNGARREPEPGRDDVRAFIRVTEVFKDLQL